MSRPTPSSSALKLSEVMKSGKYSDLTFVCDGDEFKVHKVIVCPQSDVLSAAVDGSFKEAKTGMIDMNTFKVEAVEHMVEFLYTGGYGTKCSCKVTSQCQHPHVAHRCTCAQEERDVMKADRGYLHHVWVNAIADYYNIGPLAELTKANIKAAYPNRMDPAEWAEVTKQALDLTGDKTFHDTLAQLAADDIKNLLAKDGLEDVIDPFAILIIGHIKRKYIGG